MARPWRAGGGRALALALALALAPGAGTAPAAVQVARLEVSGSRVLKPEEVGERLGLRAGAAVDTLALGPAAEALASGLAAVGYLDARVVVRWTALPAAPGPPDSGAAATPPRLAFVVRLDAGEPWRVGNVLQTGADSVVAARMGPREIAPGRVWNRAALERDLAAWLDGYDDSGFAYARLWPVELAADSGALSITLRHEPGPRVRLTGLDLEGARAVSARQVERIMGFVPGAPFQRARLALGVDRLRQAGLFAEVAEPELVAGADPAEGRLRLRVREAPPGSISGILGYSGADKRFAGHLDFRLRNLGGGGRQLDAAWSGQTRGTTLYRLGYREPRLLGRPVDGTLQVEHLLFDTLYVRTRFEVGVSWRPTAALRLDGAVGADRATVTAGLNRSYGSTRWHGTARWDGRNPGLWADRGALLLLDGEFGQSLSGAYGDLAGGEARPIFRGKARGELYRPAWRRAIVALTLEAHTLRTRANPVPQYELFPLGGAVSLRGYREEQFYTPAYLLGQLEYRFAATHLGSGAYLFTDMAWFAAPDARVSAAPPLDRHKLGYGVGLRVASRLGRVGVDYGLAAGEGPLDGRIHLRLEAEF